MSPCPVFISTSLTELPLLHKPVPFVLLLLSFTFCPMHRRLLCGPSVSQPLNAIFIIPDIFFISLPLRSRKIYLCVSVCLCLCVWASVSLFIDINLAQLNASTWKLLFHFYFFSCCTFVHFLSGLNFILLQNIYFVIVFVRFLHLYLWQLWFNF